MPWKEIGAMMPSAPPRTPWRPNSPEVVSPATESEMRGRFCFHMGYSSNSSSMGFILRFERIKAMPAGAAQVQLRASPAPTTTIYEEEVGPTVFKALLLVLRARLYCEALRELRFLIPTGFVELLSGDETPLLLAWRR
jgi:hypothetical protein